MSEFDETTVVPVDDTPPTRRNPLVLVLAVVATIAAAAAVWFFLVTPLLLGDDAGANDDPAATPAADGVADEAPTSEAPAEDAADALDLPVVTYEVFLARDPFEPVVPEPVSQSTPTGDDATGEPVADDTDGDGTNDDSDTSDDSTSGCTDGDEPVCDGRVLSLIEISEAGGHAVAVIQVDTTIYEVGEGEVFAGSFLLQSIGTDRVRIIYGDDVVDLSVGDRVLK